MRWADKHLVIPRWIISMIYIQVIVLGIVAAIAGVPTIDLTTFKGYLTPWSIALATGALVGAIASLREQWEWIELIGAVILVGCLLVYCYGAWTLFHSGGELDAGRAAFAIVITIITDIPAIRLAYMLSRVGKEKGPRPPTGDPPLTLGDG
jgi:hypothetical protein